MGAVFGYCRASTRGQKLDEQSRRLVAAGAFRIFTDIHSSRKIVRTGMQALLSSISEGDIIVVTGLDRLGGTLTELLDTVNSFSSRKAALICLEENINTTFDSLGVIFGVFRALSGAEKVLRAERTGGTVTGDRGTRRGRPPIDANRISAALVLVEAGLTPSAAADKVGVGRSTVYRAARQAGIQRAQRIVPREFQAIGSASDGSGH